MPNQINSIPGDRSANRKVTTAALSKQVITPPERCHKVQQPTTSRSTLMLALLSSMQKIPAWKAHDRGYNVLLLVSDPAMS